MRIHVVTGAQAESNTGYHVANLLSRISEKGANVSVEFDALTEGSVLDLLRGAGARVQSRIDPQPNCDILYLWNPRARQREVAQMAKFARLAIHVEDNDFEIIRVMKPEKQHVASKEIHDLISQADLVTGLSSKIPDLFSSIKYFVSFLPGVDDLTSTSSESPEQLFGRKLSNAIVYAGNVTPFVSDGLTEIASAVKKSEFKAGYIPVFVHYGQRLRRPFL